MEVGNDDMVIKIIIVTMRKIGEGHIYIYIYIYIDSDCMSTHLGLFYDLRLENCIYSTFIFTIFVYFLKNLAHIYMISGIPI